MIYRDGIYDYTAYMNNKKWSTTSLELNIVKWGDNPEKYDLRRWKIILLGNGAYNDG